MGDGVRRRRRCLKKIMVRLPRNHRHDLQHHQNLTLQLFGKDASGKRLERVPSPHRTAGRARSLTSNSSGALPAILGKVYTCDVIVDSGASRSVLPLNVLEKILEDLPEVYIEDLPTPLDFILADGSTIQSNQKAFVDVAIQLNHGTVNINQVQFYILPSSSDEVLVGTPAQRCLGPPDFTDVLEDMARNNEHASDLPVTNSIVEEGQAPSCHTPATPPPRRRSTVAFKHT